MSSTGQLITPPKAVHVEQQLVHARERVVGHERLAERTADRARRVAAVGMRVRPAAVEKEEQDLPTQRLVVVNVG